MNPHEPLFQAVEPVARDLAVRLAESDAGQAAGDSLQVREILFRLAGDEGMRHATAEGAAAAPDGGRAMAKAWHDDAPADVQEAIAAAFWGRWMDALGVVAFNAVVGAIHRLGRLPAVSELSASTALVDVAAGIYSTVAS